MTAPAATTYLPLDRVSDVQSGSRAPVWWAMILLVAIETTVFLTFISSYFYLWMVSAEWPPAGVEPPDLMLPLINTGVLFTSSMVVLWATKGIRKGDQRRLKLGIGIGAALEGVFFTIKMLVSTGLPFGWSSHAYGSIFATIDRLHSAHVVVAILMAVIVEILALRGYFHEKRMLGVEVVNIYWQFVAIIWLPVFVVLFLLPRWV